MGYHGRNLDAFTHKRNATASNLTLNSDYGLCCISVLEYNGDLVIPNLVSLFSSKSSCLCVMGSVLLGFPHPYKSKLRILNFISALISADSYRMLGSPLLRPYPLMREIQRRGGGGERLILFISLNMSPRTFYF